MVWDGNWLYVRLGSLLPRHELSFTLCLGGVLIGLSLLFKRYAHFRDFAHSTYVMGLLYLFIALWILSIFGNYGDLNSWYNVKQYELLHWGVLSHLLPSSRLFMV
jgi:hypothetical protein